MTIPQSPSRPLSPPISELGFAGSLLVLSGLLLFVQELAMSFPGGISGPATRLTISAICAWGLLRRYAYAWAWWTSVLVGGVWLLLDLMTAATMFALSGSLEPLYRWPTLPLAGAFIAQAGAMALLLRQRTRLPPAVTLSLILLGLVVVVLALQIIASKVGDTEKDLGGSIYSAVAEKVRTPAVKVWIGTVNGVKGVRVVIADSTLIDADSATQAGPSRELATLVRSLLPTGSDLKFIGIGWSLDTGPGVIPSNMHRFSVDEPPQGTPDAPR